MARLPINFLLYTCSVGLALGSAWTFYDTMTGPEGPSSKEIGDESTQHIRLGRERTPADRRDVYGGEAEAWWKSFQRANFTGEEKKPKEVEAPVETKPEVPATLAPLEEILDVVGLAFDSSSGGGRCVVRYKPTADVRPPEIVRPAGAPAASAYAGPQDLSGAPNDAAAGVKTTVKPPLPRPGMPAYTSQDQRIYQVLEIGDALWPIYSDIVFVGVQEDGLAAIFSRKRPNEEKPVEERLIPSELGLPQDVLAALAKDPVPVSPRPGPKKPSEPRAEGDWVDVPETKAVRPGEWHISRSDDEYLRQNAQKVFNEDFSARSYQSSSGAVSGLQVTRVSPRLERFGVRKGDVLLELNGVKVSSKAQAIKVGKRMYEQGVRRFTAKILTGYGRVEERTYFAPERD